MKLPKRARPRAEIFIGAMADISFLLVIFFMVTSAFAVLWGLDLGLPADEDCTGGSIDYVESVDILVRNDGSLQVDRQPMDRGDLLDYVGGKLRSNPVKPVILRAEPEASYGDFLAILDLLRTAPERAGFSVVRLAIPTYREMRDLWSPAT